MSKKDSKSKGINPTNYADIPAFADDSNLVHAVIETPQGIRHKYAFEPKYGIMLLKQTLAEGLTWPYDYGFVPQTLGDDGDPLDILVLNDTALFSGCLQRVRLIGGVLLKKNGEENDRLIACPTPTPGTALPVDAFHEIGDVPDAMLDGIKRFLIEYSEEEGNAIEFGGCCSKQDAFERVKAGHARFKKKKG
jgi:inorganic pyrophosphatase